MNKQRRYEKLILLMELLGFGGVLLLIWLDEYVDIPFRYLGALPTPARPQEYWFETVGGRAPPGDGDRERDSLDLPAAAFPGGFHPDLRLVPQSGGGGSMGQFRGLHEAATT